MTSSIKTAIAQGYTEPFIADCAAYNLEIMVRPNEDMEGTFRAYDLTCDQFVKINGWLWTFEEIDKLCVVSDTNNNPQYFAV